MVILSLSGFGKVYSKLAVLLYFRLFADSFVKQNLFWILFIEMSALGVYCFSLCSYAMMKVNPVLFDLVAETMQCVAAV